MQEALPAYKARIQAELEARSAKKVEGGGGDEVPRPAVPGSLPISNLRGGRVHDHGRFGGDCGRAPIHCRAKSGKGGPPSCKTRSRPKPPITDYAKRPPQDQRPAPPQYRRWERHQHPPSWMSGQERWVCGACLVVLLVVLGLTQLRLHPHACLHRLLTTLLQQVYLRLRRVPLLRQLRLRSHHGQRYHVPHQSM